MAKIKFGKQGHLELEISPLTIWSNPGSEGVLRGRKYFQRKMDR